MAIEFSENFNGVSGDTLETYSANWSKLSGTTNGIISDAGRVRLNGTTQYWHTFTPSGADYEVAADCVCITDGSAFRVGVIARAIDTSNYFYLRYAGNTTGWQLFRRVSGVATQMGSNYAGDIGAGNTVRATLVCNGDQISAYLDSTLIIGPITYNAALTAAGQIGVYNASSSVVSNTSGVHLDNLDVNTLSGGNVVVSGQLAIAASDSIPTTSILGSITSSAKLVAAKSVAIATSVSVAGGSGTTVINKIAAGISAAVSGTVVLGSKLVQGIISSAKAVAIPTTVFIYDPSATPTIFQRMNFLRRFIGRR